MNTGIPGFFNDIARQLRVQDERSEELERQNAELRTSIRSLAHSCGVANAYADPAPDATDLLVAIAARNAALMGLADEARKAVASWAGGQQVFPAMTRRDASDWLDRYAALAAARGEEVMPDDRRPS